MRPVTTLFLLAGLIFNQSLSAQSSEEPVEEIPFFDVELIIFKNNQVPKGREFVLPVSSPGKTDPILDLSSPTSIEAALQQEYTLLNPDEFRLMDLYARLVESPRYEVLLHAAWRQPGLEREQTLPIWLRGGKIYGNEFTSIDNQIEFFENDTEESDLLNAELLEIDEENLEAMELQLQKQLEEEQQKKRLHGGLYELEGKITIALSRYLHTYVDLVLRRPRLSIDPVLNSSLQDNYLASQAADTRILNNHRMQEHRRMRSKTLHYLDNPEFSLLIIIHRHEFEETIETLDETFQSENSEATDTQAVVVTE
ncbi:MAG: CsiV family protein [Pseudomonadota bacterium]